MVVDFTILMSVDEQNPVDWFQKSHMGVSENNGTPKSSILIGFSIIFTIHFGGFPTIFGNIHILRRWILSKIKKRQVFPGIF